MAPHNVNDSSSARTRGRSRPPARDTRAARYARRLHRLQQLEEADEAETQAQDPPPPPPPQTQTQDLPPLPQTQTYSYPWPPPRRVPRIFLRPPPRLGFLSGFTLMAYISSRESAFPSDAPPVLPPPRPDTCASLNTRNLSAFLEILVHVNKRLGLDSYESAGHFDLSDALKECTELDRREASREDASALRCLVCLTSKVRAPVRCAYCKASIGCQHCIKKWMIASLRNTDSPPFQLPRCPNCRHAWEGKMLDGPKLARSAKRVHIY